MTKTVQTPGQLLADAGRALYGEEWTGPLSRALGINLRACQRWKEAAAKGDTYQVSRTLLAELEQLVTTESSRRRAEAMRVADALSLLHSRPGYS